MRPTFYNGCKAAIVVFDLSRPETLDNVLEWYEDLKKYCGEVPTVMFGNKCDLTEEYDKKKVDEIVKKHKFLSFSLTSAKTGIHVKDAFNSIIDVLVERALKNSQ